MGGMFISYRREDSAGWTGRIYDYLSARLGVEREFVDVAAIRPGEDFAQAIEKRRSCRHALVVTGRACLEWVQ